MDLKNLVDGLGVADVVKAGPIGIDSIWAALCMTLTACSGLAVLRVGRVDRMVDLATLTGAVVIGLDAFESYLLGQPIERLPGVGPKTAARLAELAASDSD